MDLEHSFTVPVGVDTAWAEFQDIASVAQCFPGATVTSVEDDSFQGSVKVKLGPIALVYNGSGTFTERDEAAHRFVVEAKGKDKRGNGTAGATVTLTMDGAGDSTNVTVVTDLAITGKPAQFGRGVMQDVSDKLLGQFVACLEQRLGNSGAPAATAEAAVAAEPAEPATPSEPAAPAEPAASAEAASPAEPATPSEPVAPVASTPPEATAPPVATPQAAASTAPSQAPAQALDLGRTVLPVLVKSYWKPAAAAVAAAVALGWIIKR
jgi:uncharacterized protein